MRRSTLCARARAAILLVLGALGGCAHARPCDGVSCAAACPRDSTIDESGRCACADGDVPLLGACVPQAVGDAFCGPAARAEPHGAGCVFRTCRADESLDVLTGACAPRGGLLRGGSIACGETAVALVEGGRATCGPPAAACPRGTTPAPALDGASGARTSGASARACLRPPACPPGSLADGNACRAVVTTGGRSGRRVDVGAWAALTLGIDGGLGSPALCQPIAQRPSLFAVGVAAPVDIRVAIAVFLPDQDVSRLHADVQARDAAGRALAPGAEAVVSDTVSTALELLRGLGGEASTAAVALEVRCAAARAGQ